eukprot:352594-Chlamydomonas_euryale.AAC.7
MICQNRAPAGRPQRRARRRPARCCMQRTAPSPGAPRGACSDAAALLEAQYHQPARRRHACMLCSGASAVLRYQYSAQVLVWGHSMHLRTHKLAKGYRMLTWMDRDAQPAATGCSPGWIVTRNRQPQDAHLDGS